MLKIKEKIGLKYLSLEFLQIAVDQYQNDSDLDPTFLLNTIDGVFSNIESLSKSFLCTYTEDLSLKDENRHPSGLNIQDIEKSYEIILSLSPSSLFLKKMVYATELLLIKLFKVVKKLENIDLPILRIFFILILVKIII